VHQLKVLRSKVREISALKEDSYLDLNKKHYLQ